MSTPQLEQPPMPPPLASGVPPAGPRPSRERFRAAALALASGIVGAGLVTGVLYATGTAGSQSKVTSVQAGLAAAAPASLQPAALYAADAPGTVDITATGTTAKSGSFPFSPPGQTQTDTGSGFLADSRGDIVTASHVVAGASSITVKLQGGTVRTAKVLGVDTSTDVAVLKIDPAGLTLHPLQLGSSGALAVGDPLAVIGDPFDYHRSLSTGVVSALSRTIQAPNGFPIPDAIQTDAAIDPGNSGGPLLNARGQVIGIADQIATSGSGADSFSGVGFAVPIDDVKAELSQLERGAHPAHAFLGIGIGQTNANGALISSVVSGGPAASAGVRTGDLVTAVGGTAVHGPNGLIAGIAAHAPGQKVTLTVQRGQTRLTLTVTLGKQPSQG